MYTVFKLIVRNIQMSLYQVGFDRPSNVEDEDNDEVQEVEIPPVKKGSLVSVYLADWNDEPVIGEVTKTSEKDFHINYYQQIDNIWQPWMLKQGKKSKVWKQKLPKGCIVLSNVKLEENKQLAKAHRDYIMKKYTEINSSKEKQFCLPRIISSLFFVTFVEFFDGIPAYLLIFFVSFPTYFRYLIILDGTP